MTTDNNSAPSASPDIGLHPDTRYQSYQASPIHPMSTGVSELSASHDSLSRTNQPHEPVSPPVSPPAEPRAAHHSPEITPAAAPPTYGEVIEERYGGVQEKPNAPQNRPPPIMVTPLTALGRQPVTVDCPRCKAAVTTRTEKHSGDRAMISGALICLCVGCLCAWIPCVIDDCKDTEHFCSKCNLALATVSAGGAVKLGAAAQQAVQEQSSSGRPGPSPAGSNKAAYVQESQYAPAANSQQAQYSSPAPPRQQEHAATPPATDANGKPLAELGT